MKIGLYSITYRGVWYPGDGLGIEAMMRLAKRQGWEGVELDTERPHAAPMDLSADDRKRIRDLAGELDLPISAVSPNSDLSSPVCAYREAMICYVRECIKLAADLGSPLCKVFAAWRGVAVRDGLGDYAYTNFEAFPDWRAFRWDYVRDALAELAVFAADHGVVLALQNHGPDVVKGYADVLRLIEEVGSPAFKACMDICNEDEHCESADWARKVVRETGPLLVHSHYNAEFGRAPDGRIEIIPDHFFGTRRPAYGAYVDALVASGYEGFMNWEFCHPAKVDGRPAGIDYVHRHTELALEYMKTLRAAAEEKASQ
jgi:sugar phosphate isomerase/epimerase